MDNNENPTPNYFVVEGFATIGVSGEEVARTGRLRLSYRIHVESGRALYALRLFLDGEEITDAERATVYVITDAERATVYVITDALPRTKTLPITGPGGERFGILFPRVERDNETGEFLTRAPGAEPQFISVGLGR